MDIARQNFYIQRWIAVLSVILFSGKIVAYYLTHSIAILADALESIVNILAGFIGLYSLYVATKPQDLNHPYGHGKAEFVSAAAEGTLIISSGLLIIYQAIVSLVHNKPLEALDAGLIIVAITAAINYIAGSACARIGRKNQSLALQSSGKHLQIDTYSTLGIIAGLAIVLWTKFYLLDKIVALLLSVVIIYNGYRILRKSLAGIMDELDMALLDRLVAILNTHRHANWIDIHNLRVIKYGRLLHVDCHITVPWYLNINEAHEEIDALKELIKNEFGNTIEMFIHTDGCAQESCAICIKRDCSVRVHSFAKKLEWTLENVLSNKRHTH